MAVWKSLQLVLFLGGGGIVSQLLQHIFRIHGNFIVWTRWKGESLANSLRGENDGYPVNSGFHDGVVVVRAGSGVPETGEMVVGDQGSLRKEGENAFILEEAKDSREHNVVARLKS